MKNVVAKKIKQAYKTEKDPRVTKRLLAVHMICFEGKNTEETANNLMQCQNGVSMWIKRFKARALMPSVICHEQVVTQAVNKKNSKNNC